MAELVGKKILHYKILEQVGQGGMGVVYKAEDTRLHRTVAIKFLPREIAGQPEERERFKIEARASAALRHPNIATVFSIEELDDSMFIVMEYIEGRELQDVTWVTDPLERINQVIEYTIQIAEGLRAAHEKGVVHRDMKPSNIMITPEGQAIIMDFGLAKMEGGEMLTKVGTTLGTAAYMSPEQTKGEVVDSRTDIWALGVILYEMIAGERPFKGHYEQAIIYSILNESPPPLTSLPSHVQSRIDAIVQKTLAKNPDDRYQKAEEMLGDLRAFSEKPQPEQAKVEEEKQEKPKEKPEKKVKKRILAFAIPMATIVIFLGLILSQRSDVQAPEIQELNIESGQGGESVNEANATHSSLMQELSEITATKALMDKINEYKTSMQIKAGNKNDFEVPEGCYIFIVDQEQVNAVLRYDGRFYQNIESEEKLEELGVKYAGKTSIWIRDLSSE